jgi:hypothetical protein
MRPYGIGVRGRQVIPVVVRLKIMKLIAKIFTASLILASAISAYANCILPSPDGGTEPTEPQIKGKIVRVVNNNVELVSTDSNKTYRFETDNKTQRFTVYGGYVAANELAAGQQAEIWFVGCDINNPVAAVIRLESTE